MKQKLLALFVLVFQLPLVHAIDMPLHGMNGEIHNLNDYKGKWIVVNYWATWCPPCIAEMPDLQAFHDEHADRDAVVIGINVENISSDQLINFLDIYSITYPVYKGSTQQKTPLGTVPGLPTTFMVSPEGTVEARQVGSVTSEMIEGFIKKWQAGRASQ